MIYAINSFVEDALATRGWRKHDLVAAMGYRDQRRGMRRLQECVCHGAGLTTDFLRRLARALQVSETVVTAIAADTERQRAMFHHEQERENEAARCASFQPYCYVQTALEQSAASSVATLYSVGHKYFSIPAELLGLPRAHCLSRVGEMVRDHFREHLGYCLHLGKISGYLFRMSYEETIYLTIDGHIVEERHGRDALIAQLMSPGCSHDTTPNLFTANYF